MKIINDQKFNYYLRASQYTKPIILSLIISFALACSNDGMSKSASIEQAYELELSIRKGTKPSHTSGVPHQQLDQNSPPVILEDMNSFLFSMDYVEEKSSRSSFASARGANIKSSIKVNPEINREFTHIHMEPGPGSQHLTLKNEDAAIVIDKGWGIKHPWSDRLSADGYMLMMIFSPRDVVDLENIKRIITAAWHLALSNE